MQSYEDLMSSYINHVFRSDPVSATRLGIHDYDHRLTDFSPAAMQATQDVNKNLLKQLRALDIHDLPREARLDLPFAKATLDLTLRYPELQRWGRGLKQPDRSPQMYPEMVSNALFPLMIGNFGPAEERMESMLKRLELVPTMLEAGKSYLTGDIPAVWVQMAQASTLGSIKFLDTAVKPFAKEVPNLQPFVEAAVEKAKAGLEDYSGFLHGLVNNAEGDFAIGREKFDYLLKQYHMVDMGSDDLYKFGLEEVERYQSGMVQVARQMGFGDDWVAAIESVKDEYPQAEDWVKVYDYEVDLAKKYVIAKDLVTVPPEGECPCSWMPVFMRDFAPIALPWSSPMFDPGYKGTWHITPLDDEASPQSQLEHLRDNSYAWIRAISHHEIFPGHYMQALIVKLTGTDFRKVFSSPIYVEGWSMYWEEYLRETGFLAAPKLHLMQLRLALWRAVRIVVDTGLHTRGMGMQEATQYLIDAARLEPRWAQSQIRGYTTSPTYQSSYLLGKKEVYDLKGDYKRYRGALYSEKDFHDTFLAYGSLPVALVRLAMLGLENEGGK